MKLLPLFFLFGFQLFSQNWIDANQTIRIDDTVYSKQTGLPYTGLITKSDDNGQIVMRVRAKNGLYVGKYYSFYPNGDTLAKAEYSNGKVNGFVYHYTSNTSFGEPTTPHCWLKIHYIDGIINGVSETYFENGNPFISSFYVDGIQTGDCAIYYETGELFAKGMLEVNEAIGNWVIFKKDKTVSSNLVFHNTVVSSCEGECIDILPYITSFDSLKGIPLKD